MAKKDKEVIKYDLQGSQDTPNTEVDVEALERKIFTLEKVLRDNGMESFLDRAISDEEYICVKGIESIRKLVANEIQTKDDIAMFDTLYRNLCIIRGIKTEKKPKEKPKSTAELYSIIKGNKV